MCLRVFLRLQILHFRAKFHNIFYPKNTVFHYFWKNLCLKMKINMLNVFPVLKYIGIGKKNYHNSLKNDEIRAKTVILLSGACHRPFLSVFWVANRQKCIKFNKTLDLAYSYQCLGKKMVKPLI